MKRVWPYVGIAGAVAVGGALVPMVGYGALVLIGVGLVVVLGLVLRVWYEVAAGVLLLIGTAWAVWRLAHARDVDGANGWALILLVVVGTGLAGPVLIRVGHRWLNPPHPVETASDSAPRTHRPSSEQTPLER